MPLRSEHSRSVTPMARQGCPLTGTRAVFYAQLALNPFLPGPPIHRAGSLTGTTGAAGGTEALPPSGTSGLKGQEAEGAGGS